MTVFIKIPLTPSHRLILPKRIHKIIFKGVKLLHGLKTGVKVVLTTMASSMFLLIPLPEIQEITVTENRKMEFVYILPGTFTMGSDEGASDEKPPHKVTFEKGFYMQKTEVTQGQWKAIMGNNPSRFQLGDNYPVESVSWNDVQTFIKKLNQEQETEMIYRLPTEAEWEYAARSEGKREKYAGFSNDEDLYLYANFCDSNCDGSWNDDGQDDGYKSTAPVGSFLPNGLGLYDMSGNVWEWCQDWFDSEYYKNSSVNDPNGPETGAFRVIRGGSWYNTAEICRSSIRSYDGSSSTIHNLGFRLVLHQDISGKPQVAKPKRSQETTGGEDLEEESSARAQVAKTAELTPLEAINQMEFVIIPAGEFLMGGLKSDKMKDNDEMPQHKVVIKNGFYMQKTEVTQGQWKAIMGSNPSYFIECGDDCPVENVSWDDVHVFITKLNKLSGKSYRLPTEAEWEYAARAGTMTKWCCGDGVVCLDSTAWYSDNSDRSTHSVGLKDPNAWGLHEMSGNVWEWVEDDLHETYSGAPSDGSPWIEIPRGASRVYRGGSWYDYARYCRPSHRGSYSPSGDFNFLGFRLVLSRNVSGEQ